MDLALSGVRALITGSTGAIGEAIARSMAREGATVIVHGRSASSATAVAASIESEVGGAFAVAADLTSDEQVAMMAAEIEANVGGVDVLVNNAGGYSKSTWWSASPSDWLNHYDANVVAAVRLVQALTPGMQAQGFGRIIQIASGLATQSFSFIPEYAATKAALLNFTVSLARELAGTGITVNTVSPGLIRTEGVETFYRSEAHARGWGDSWIDIEAGVLRDVLPNAVGRLGRVDEVAEVVTFLASPISAYVNGANIRVDGASTTSVN